MTIPLRTLIVEDSEDDTLLLVKQLRQGGFIPEYTRVETADGMRRQLENATWDIVFSDFTMPNFSAFSALELLHASGNDLPFIIVSGTIGEDRAVAAMKAGAHDYILKDNTKRLLPAVERELREAEGRRERRWAEERLQRLAYSDPLTGLLNRVRFRELVQEAVILALAEQRTVALLLMDLDRFKEVNDTLGHDRGDVLLQQVGIRLSDALSASCMVARLGGDEFGILVPPGVATADAQPVIKTVQSSLEALFIIDGVPIAVEASIGVALMSAQADNADTLLQQADIAMYHARQMASGYAVYTPEYDRHNPERLALMAELRDAIEHGQLRLQFQPKLELKTGRIVGTEALVRWQHPRHGLLAPDKFISVAEPTGLIGPLTNWVLIDALRHCQGASREGIHLRVSVNLSARSLHDQRLLEIVEHGLKTTGADARQLTLEITESAIMLDPQRAERILAELSSMGVWLSIDDFGTGYTSLASIKRLPVNEIKIDKTFITGMLADKKDAMIVRSVIELGHNFGLTVVAEGVETQEMFDSLSLLGCDQVQGNFISCPLSCERLKLWLQNSPWKTG